MRKCPWCNIREPEPRDEFHHCRLCCDVAAVRAESREKEEAASRKGRDKR